MHVFRRTNTTLRVLLESRVDDDWNVDGGRDLSEPWSGFTQFTILNEKPPDGCTWSGGRLTKIEAYSRPDHLWQRCGPGMSRVAQRKEKQEWAIGKTEGSTLLEKREASVSSIRKTWSSKKP